MGGKPELMKQLIFYFDVVCPFAYLASTRIDALAERAGVSAEWTPILLGGVFREIGAPDVPAAQMPPQKARLNLVDMKRWAALFDVPLIVLPEGHPRRTVEAMRLVHAAPPERRKAIAQALYRAYFAEGRNIADRAVLAEVCAAVGLPPELARSGIDAEPVKQALRAATERAVADGVFGVPAFVVVDGARRTLYWGQDRMHFVERALAA